MVVQAIHTEPGVGRSPSCERVFDLHTPFYRSLRGHPLGEACLPVVGVPHVREELLGAELRPGILEDYRAALGGHQHVVGEVRGRPQRHHADARDVANVYGVGEQQRAHVAGPHLRLNLAKSILAEPFEVYTSFQQSVRLPEGTAVPRNFRLSPIVLELQGSFLRSRSREAAVEEPVITHERSSGRYGQ